MSSEQDRELLPCPFCGGRASTSCDTYSWASATEYVSCNDCPANTGPCETATEAVAAWNTRAAAALAKGEGKV